MGAKLAWKVIEVLTGRGGFDGWWGDIDHSIKLDIVEEIQEVLDAGVPGEPVEPVEEEYEDEYED